MSAAAKPERKKPVALQLNNSGAWKTVIRFDAIDDMGCMRVLDAADALGMAHQGAAMTFRVIVDDASPSPDVLMRWSRGESWRDTVRP